MAYDILDELFEKISKVTSLKDVAYHQIKEGKLNPIHKTSTDTLGIDKWKSGHYANPVYIKDTFVLQEIVRTKEYVAISDTKNDTRSSEAFFFFGVDSNLIIPVIKNDEVEGIVCTVSINEVHNFTQEEIDECVKLVNDYKDKL
jgi:acetolactate synthase-1/2/3 large subunit